MKNTNQLIPLGGLLATMAVAAYRVVQLNGQSPAVAGDYTNAATVQVRDGQGQIVLQGLAIPPDCPHPSPGPPACPPASRWRIGIWSSKTALSWRRAGPQPRSRAS